MFSSFAGTLPDAAAARRKAKGSGKGKANGQDASSPPDAPRSKRIQVTRACDSCRVHRSKCDNDQPCSNCQHRGERCSNDGSSDIRTMPSAIRYTAPTLQYPTSTDAFQRDPTIEIPRPRPRTAATTTSRHGHCLPCHSTRLLCALACLDRDEAGSSQ